MITLEDGSQCTGVLPEHDRVQVLLAQAEAWLAHESMQSIFPIQQHVQSLYTSKQAKKSFSSEMQSIIDKFSAAAGSLEDLQTRLREGFNLGEGWIRDTFFGNLVQELKEQYSKVASDLAGLTPDVNASVERLASAERELREEKKKLEDEKEILQSVSKKMDGLGESHDSLVKRLEAAIAASSDAREEGLREGRQESADKIECLVQELEGKESQIEALQLQLKQSAAQVEEKDLSILAINKELSDERLQHLKFLQGSHADTNSTNTAINTRLTRVEQVATAMASNVEAMAGVQVDKEQIGQMQEGISTLTQRVTSSLEFSRKREREVYAGDDAGNNARRVRIIERTPLLTSSSSRPLHSSSSAPMGFPGLSDRQGEASESGSMPIGETLSDQAAEPGQEVIQAQPTTPEEGPDEEEHEEDRFANVWPLIDFGVWANNPGKLEAFKTEFRESAGTRITSPEAALQVIADHVKGNRQSSPECICFLAAMRRTASKCGTRKDPVLTRDGCQARHNNSRELCVYFLAAPGASVARWVLHERT
jgi:GAF domain-containing protein